jgi:hypothetical protein
MSDAKTIAVSFALWIDTNCVRAGQNEFTWRGDNFKRNYTTEALYDIFISEI